MDKIYPPPSPSLDSINTSPRFTIKYKGRSSGIEHLFIHNIPNDYRAKDTANLIINAGMAPYVSTVDVYKYSDHRANSTSAARLQLNSLLLFDPDYRDGDQNIEFTTSTRSSTFHSSSEEIMANVEFWVDEQKRRDQYYEGEEEGDGYTFSPEEDEEEDANFW